MLQSREETPKIMLSALGKGMNLNCLPRYPPIRANMNSNFFLKVMTSAINAQLPKKVIDVMVFV